MDKSFYCDGVTRRKVKDGYYTSGGKTITATLVIPAPSLVIPAPSLVNNPPSLVNNPPSLVNNPPSLVIPACC